MLRVGRWFKLAVAAAALGLLCKPAAAQQPAVIAPPAYQVTDANGVDLASGNFNTTSPSISIGPAGKGLSFSLSYDGAGSITIFPGLLGGSSGNVSHWGYFRSSLDGGYFDGDLSYVASVSTGETSEQFTEFGAGPAGPFTSFHGGAGTLVATNGSTGISSPSVYFQIKHIYTAADGTIVNMGSLNAGTTKFYDRGSNDEGILSIVRPDGETLTYTYTTYTSPLVGSGHTYAHIQSVSSSLGYQIHLTYDATNPNLIVKAVAINTQSVACDPAANDCGALPSSWPTLNISYTATSFNTWTVAVSDSNGHTTTYSLDDAQTGLVSIQRPSGQTVHYTFVATATDTTFERDTSFNNGAATWSYVYSAVGGSTPTQVTATDPLGHVRTVALSQTGGLSSGMVGDDYLPTTADGIQRHTHIDYDSFGRILAIHRPAGDADSYTYDGRGNVTQLQNTSRPGYGDSLTTIADYPAACSGLNPDGSQITPSNCNKPLDVYTWDGVNQLQLGRTDYAYDPQGNLVTETRPPNAGNVRSVITYHYDSIAVAGGTVSRLTHIYQCKDPTQATCTGSPDETVTDINYAGSIDGSATSVTTHAGNGSVSTTTSTAYDVVGNVVSVTTPLGQSTLSYDNVRQLTGQTSPSVNGGANPASVITYWPDGQVQTTSQGLAAGGNLTSGFTPAATTTSQYDTVGRKIRDYTTGGDQSAVTDYSYDALGRPLCVAVRMNPTTFGGPTSAPLDACTMSGAGSNGPDRITLNNYDAVGQVTSVVQANGVPGQQRSYVSATYGAGGEKLTEADANGNVTGYEYDGLLRLSKTKFPDIASNPNDFEQFGYDTAGNLNSRRLRDGTPLSANYDSAGNRIFDWDGSTLGYDNAGHVISATNTAGHTVTMSYDALGRTASESAPAGTTTFQYNEAGGVARMTWSDGAYVTYDHNAATGAVTAIKENGSAVLASYTYDDYGRRVGSSQLNGAGSAFGYDGLSRLSSLSHTLPSPGQSQALGFSYNPASQIAAKTTSNSAYDWKPPGPATRAYSNNGLNQVTSAAGNTISYTGSNGDGARGNITSDGTNSYSYSKLNQLTGYTQVVAGVTTKTATLDYDGLGRLWRTVGSGTGTTTFAYSGSQLVAEYDASNTITNRYVPGPDGADDPIVWYQGSSLATKFWLHQDNQETVIAVTDASGALVNGQAYTYDEYGVGAVSNTARFQYTGQIWIPEIQLYSYKARMYSSNLGRFMQTDPIMYGSDYNIYAYAAGDPINQVDPSGMAPPVSPATAFSACPDGQKPNSIGACPPTPNIVVRSDGTLGPPPATPPPPAPMIPLRNKPQNGACRSPPTSAAEAAAAKAGNRQAYWSSRAARGDPLGQTALSIVNNSGVGAYANGRLFAALSEGPDSDKGFKGIQADIQSIGVALMQQNVAYTASSGGNVTPAGVAAYHFAVFGAFGVPSSTFGGTPFTGTTIDTAVTAPVWFHCGP